MNPHHSTTVQDTLLPTRGKRGRHGKERANERNLPLSSPITSEESRRILAQRASAMLEVGLVSILLREISKLSVYHSLTIDVS